MNCFSRFIYIKEILPVLCPGISVGKFSYDLNLIDKLRGKLVSLYAYFPRNNYVKKCEYVINI